MSTSFISADDARKGARNNLLIHQEINGIEETILKAIDDYKFSTVVSSGTPMTTVRKVESVEVTSGGSGYSVVNAIVSIDHPLGINASITPNVENGFIKSYTINNGGTGYNPISASIDMTASGNGNALLQPIVLDGVITQINILSGGSGYSVSDVISFVHPNGTGATAEIVAVNVGGSIISVNLTSGGQDYGTIYPELVVDHPTGNGAKGTVVTNGGVITDILVTNFGVGYTPVNPSATVMDSMGVGSSLKVNLSSGSVESIDVVSGGYNYTESATVVITDVQGGSGSGATAEVTVTESENPVNTKDYYDVFVKQSSDRAIQDQFNAIIAYFENLGYTIKLIENPDTISTIAWEIFW